MTPTLTPRKHLYRNTSLMEMEMEMEMEKESFFSSNGAPKPWHLIFAICFGFSFFIARFTLDKFVLRRLAIYLVGKGAAPFNLSKATQTKLVKCSESMWKLTYYALMEACILRILYHEPWFTDINHYFTKWPNQELKLPLKLYYTCQCGFYLYSIVALVTWETRRKDFAVMMSHHVITVFLIGYSYVSSFFRIGSVVLALHDVSDVFMEAGKIFTYSGKDLPATASLALFALAWLLLRLIYFPFWVIKASSYDLCAYLDLAKPYDKSLYYVFNTTLLMLLVFHVYWWILICKMIMRMLANRGKVGQDVRSDSEDDDDD